MGLQNLLTKAKRLTRGREQKIDRGLDKAQQTISERTGGKYDDKLQNARSKIDENLSEQPTDPGSQHTENRGDTDKQ